MTTLNFDTKLNFMFILRNSTDELLKYASICDNIYKYITKIKTGDMVSIIKEIKLNNMSGGHFDYKQYQLDEFYVLSKLLGISWRDYHTMPTYARRYLIDKIVESFSKN